MLDGSPPDSPKVHSGRIEFIFVFIQADTPQQLSERIGLVSEVGIQRNALIDGVLGPMVVKAFGTVGSAHPAGSRQHLVGDLHQRFGTAVKIGHGAADGHFGVFGGRKYTFTFPRFDEALATLVRLNFGCTEELLP